MNLVGALLKNQANFIGTFSGIISGILLCGAVAMQNGTETPARALGILGLVFGAFHLLSAIRAQSKISSLSELVSKSESELQILTKDQDRLSADLAKTLESLEVTKAEVHDLDDEIKFANEAYSRTSRRLQELFASLPVAAISFDLTGTVFEWNRAAEQLTGVMTFGAFGQSLASVLPSGLSFEFIDSELNQITNGEPTQEHELLITNATGETIPILWKTYPLNTPEGQLTGAIAVMVDVSRYVSATEWQEAS